MATLFRNIFIVMLCAIVAMLLATWYFNLYYAIALALCGYIIIKLTDIDFFHGIRANGACANNVSGENLAKTEFLFGHDAYSNEAVYLSDTELNQHALVIGTTGSGKTTTLMNIVTHAANKSLPLIYIDGKGNQELAKRMGQIARYYQRPFKVFSLDDFIAPDNSEVKLNSPASIANSASCATFDAQFTSLNHNDFDVSNSICAYNPFSCGNFTEWKNKIITLAQDADNKGQEHYALQEQSYISLLCEIIYKAQVYVDLEGIVAYLNHPQELQKLANRIDARLALRFAAFDDNTKHHSDIAKILEGFYFSHYGKLFSTSNKPAHKLIDLYQALVNKEIVLFLLNSASYKKDTTMLGRLIINDINAVWTYFVNKHQQRINGYCVFDEFASYASPNMASVLALQRDNGLHAVIGTQSISAISLDNHALKRVAVELIANCNTFIVHKLNDADDIDRLVTTVGNYDALVNSYSRSDNAHNILNSSALHSKPLSAPTVVNSSVHAINISNQAQISLTPRKEWLLNAQQIRHLDAGMVFLCRMALTKHEPRLVRVHKGSS